MDVCERVAHHDAAGPAWRDKYFVECVTALMNPATCMSVGVQPWLPALLQCCVLRLNCDTDPLLPAREAIAALQVLASLARCPGARPAVKQSILALGERVDELFHDRLQGIRSVGGADVAGLDPAMNGQTVPAAPNASARSVVHNTLVVCLIRCEDYRFGAAEMLELVDGDVGALMSILLAISKVATYELGITANCLGVVDALTQPSTYFSASASNERSFVEFTAKIRTLHTVWASAKAFDTIVPAIYRRAVKFTGKMAKPSDMNAAAIAGAASSGPSSAVTSPVTPMAPANQGEAADELAAFARCMTSLCRAVSNMVHFTPDLSDATQLRQHVLVVQDTCTTFASLLITLGGTVNTAAAVEQQKCVAALSAALELQALASRDVLRVPKPLQTAIVVAVSAALDVLGNPAHPAPKRFVTSAVVALANAGLLARDAAMVNVTGVAGVDQDGDFEAHIRAAAVANTERLAALISLNSTDGSASDWVADISAHPNAHHQRAADIVTVLSEAQSAAIDDEVARVDAETARLEHDLEEMKTARGQIGTLQSTADAAPAKQPKSAPQHQQQQQQPPSSSVQSGSLLGSLPSVGKVGGVASSAAPVQANRALAFADLDDSSPRRPGMAAKQQPSAAVAPAEYLCALRGTLMLEPVLLPCGRHVDRQTLADVIRDIGHVDPVTAKPLPNDFDETAVDTAHKNKLSQFRFQLAMQAGPR